ncbi:hypothetical protein BRM22_24405 [Xanthomonas oryzae pv. oryzae]|nr:hypothetical protein B9W05_18775 [Xanthomonas oryzae pv. oryzae]AXI15963.1 hypothetical protein CDO19_00210 [Xanthomonas oryzae pv. oryzae]AXI19914.1 hypothetical protein CDO11_00210 [Xanthomonas oryzae pv. oryzae]AXM08168.1 hypothetical protein BRM60_00220 [Xanthomonas oryzae pv. oryzae]AXM11975.1 hypothetical protein BRN32_00220 [Xanthomonas oryzae pv. oryzae]
MDEAKAVTARHGERAPVNRGIPTESARSGEISKIQTPLFGTMRHPALSGLVVQTFLRLPSCGVVFKSFSKNLKRCSDETEPHRQRTFFPSRQLKRRGGRHQPSAAAIVRNHFARACESRARGLGQCTA